jgi:hypothetical protein
MLVQSDQSGMNRMVRQQMLRILNMFGGNYVNARKNLQSAQADVVKVSYWRRNHI